MSQLGGKRAFITGGASGMGLAQAETFIAEGAHVVIADVNESEGRAAEQRLGARCHFLALDVRDEQAWSVSIQRAETLLEGSIDILSNTAGILRTGTVEATTLATYRACVDVMQVGVFLGMRSVVASMRRAGGGSIINMSSTAGIVGYPDLVAYTAAKWAVRGMTKAAALDLAPYRIRVNSVHPGNTDTPMLKGLDVPVDTVPLKRNATPREVAALCLYLASDASAYVTGTEHIIDGGVTACGAVTV